MKYIKCNYKEIYEISSKLLLENKVIGWYQGKSEYGPRALGNRSILANPMFDNKDYLNQQIKNREWWRPYAPIIMNEYVHDYFDVAFEKSPYMMFSGFVKKDKKKILPAITHADGSTRIQTVEKSLNLHIYNLLENFNNIGGVPLLLNTSFNLSGEPIVETPSDAINTFMNSKLDVLILHNYIIER